MAAIEIELTDEQETALRAYCAGMPSNPTLENHFGADIRAKADDLIKSARLALLAALNEKDPAMVAQLEAQVKARLDEIASEGVEQ